MTWQHNLAHVRADIATVLVKRGDAARARPEYQAAAAVLEQLVA